MKKSLVSNYSGYHHNRYDGFNCSRGVLAALGASRTADCFANSDDYPDSIFEKRWNGKVKKYDLKNKWFRNQILANLDIRTDELIEISKLESGTYEHYEYWGDKIVFEFKNCNGQIVVTIDRTYKHICEF